MHHTCQIHVSSVEMGAEYAIAFKKKKKKDDGKSLWGAGLGYSALSIPL